MKPGSVILNRRQKRQPLELHHPRFPQKKNLKGYLLSVGKVIITVFWDCEEVIVVDAKPSGETINSDASNWHSASAWRHKAEYKTRKATTKFGWTASPIYRPQISTCLKPWRMQSAVRNFRLMTMWFAQRGTGYVSKKKHWRMAVEVDGHFVKKKIGNQVKTSLFIICDFHNLGINIY